MKFKSLLTIDCQYKENLNLYSKKDGVFALILFGIMCVSYAVIGYFNKNKTGSSTIFTGIIFNVIISVITIIFVKIRKQSVTTIGLFSGRKLLSIILGSILAVIFVHLQY